MSLFRSHVAPSRLLSAMLIATLLPVPSSANQNAYPQTSPEMAIRRLTVPTTQPKRAIHRQASQMLAAQASSPPPGNSTLPLMPAPASVQLKAGRLPVDEEFSVSHEGHKEDRLERAIARFLQQLGARTGLTLREAQENGQPAKLVIHAETAGMEVQGLEEDESYSLEINSAQGILRAHTVVGVIRGLETLSQLLQADREGFYFPSVTIKDRPRFAWRGLLLDVSRHWEPVEIIKRTLDSMAVVKLNVLHWHLSDDQGFRVESLRFPRLHQLGSEGLYYTQAEIRNVVAYARDRGIRVVPEFDMPGHAHAWFIGYPQFASAPGPYAFKHYLGGDSVPFDPSQEHTYEFIDNFLGEMTTLFPDTYWHVGGDEVDGTPWDANPEIQTFRKRHSLQDTRALQTYFIRRVESLIEKRGKQLIGWDEILSPDLPKDAVVESWTGTGTLALAAKGGYRGILAAPYYLDKMFKTSSYYEGDPLPAGNDLDPPQSARILGGEACVWGELVSEENIESRIWPYAAAIAERLWSPREISDVQDMYRRLDLVSSRLEEAGSRHLTNPAAMLRRAAGGEVPNAASDLLGLLEPLRLGLRQEQRRPTQLDHLTALGDIVVSDPPAARKFAAQVTSFLEDAPHYVKFREDLLHEFAAWRGRKATITGLAARAPAFHDAEGAASDLAELGAAGEEAIDFLARGATPSGEWTRQRTQLLERAAQPKGLLRIAVLETMRRLILSTSEGH